MTSDTPWKTRNVLEGRETPLTCGEVGDLFNVDPKTVARWANAGKIGSFKTLGGHRRFEVDEVRRIMAKLHLKY